MKLYLALSRIFPRSFTAKVFFVAFVGTHVPLISMLVWSLFGTEALTEQVPALLVILGATLVGSGATLAALKAILTPVYVVETAMREFEETGMIANITEQSDDELGRLMRRASRLMKSAQSKLQASENRADMDPLTNVLNRRGFDRRVKSTDKGAIIHFDIDFFKKINDGLGHDKGDEVLCEVAKVAARNLRSNDLLARFGGEEFVIFLPETDQEEALMVAERLRAAFAAEVVAGDAPVTASVGVAVGPENVSELIKQADEATYEAKRAGRNQVRLRVAGSAA